MTMLTVGAAGAAVEAFGGLVAKHANGVFSQYLKEKFKGASVGGWLDLATRVEEDASARYMYLNGGTVGLSYKKNCDPMKDIMDLLHNAEDVLGRKRDECHMEPFKTLRNVGDLRKSDGMRYDIGCGSHVIDFFPIRASSGDEAVGWSVDFRNGNRRMTVGVGIEKRDMLDGLAPYLTTWMRDINRKEYGDVVYSLGVIHKSKEDAVKFWHSATVPSVSDWSPTDLLLNIPYSRFGEVASKSKLGKRNEFDIFIGKFRSGIESATNYPSIVLVDNCAFSPKSLVGKIAHVSSLLQPHPENNGGVFSKLIFSRESLFGSWVDFVDKHSDVIDEVGQENTLVGNTRLFLACDADVCDDVDAFPVIRNNIIWARNELLASLPVDLTTESCNELRSVILHAAQAVEESWQEHYQFDAVSGEPVDYFKAVVDLAEQVAPAVLSPSGKKEADAMSVFDGARMLFRNTFNIQEESSSMSLSL